MTSLPAGVLVAGGIAFALLIGFGARLVVRAVVPVGESDHVPRVAAPLMPALGAVFGVLIALTLAGEAGYLKSAQDIVANEAAAASRLAWGGDQPRCQIGADPHRVARLPPSDTGERVARRAR